MPVDGLAGVGEKHPGQKQRCSPYDFMSKAYGQYSLVLAMIFKSQKCLHHSFDNTKIYVLTIERSLWK